MKEINLSSMIQSWSNGYTKVLNKIDLDGRWELCGCLTGLNCAWHLAVGGGVARTNDLMDVLKD
jgi:hypothetical protein